MSARKKELSIRFRCTEIYSNVVAEPFVIFFLSVPAFPRTLTLTSVDTGIQQLVSKETPAEMALIGQMYCSRLNDNSQQVSQYLGSIVVDLSTVSDQEYRFVVKDASSRRPLRTGQISVAFEMPRPLTLRHLRVQNEGFSREMYSAADANLKWIQGFSSRGLPSIVDGLHYVHSPYYVNHMGVTLPSGAFCMIPTTLEDDFTKAVRSHKQRLVVALARNCMSSADWMSCLRDLMSNSLKSKHLRCLTVVADAVTLHARLDMHYTPDVQLLPTPKGTERWSIPREPESKGGLSFTGDCEDFAREVYQQCKEIREWIKPGPDSLMSCLSCILHMYVPTIEQGAVDSEAHSKYITYDAAYRNHIWAALHPRHAWRTKMQGTVSLDALYEQWPEQPCEKTLPLLHLEGTGDVYPVVTCRKPGYIAKMKNKCEMIQSEWPFVFGLETPDMSLQCSHKSSFYKYAIAFMTDIFKDQGVLDYTYITDHKYGVSIYDWARGKYIFRASTQHSAETMDNIKSMIDMERPIPPITTESIIVNKFAVAGSGYFLRFGSKEPIDSDYELQSHYKIGSHKWYEAYFKVDNSRGSSSELDIKL